MSITYQEAVRLARNYTKDSHTVADAHINGLCQVLEQVGAERDAAIKCADRLEAEIQDRAVNDGDAVASDIYFYCMDLLEPHNFTGHPRELNGREDEYLPCSVGESMKFLIDFWVTSRPKIKDMEEVKAERDSMAESARHFANGQEFYQGIVRRIGKLFGEAARTSDDGSVQDDVLALKVPELVEALATHVERGKSTMASLCEKDFTNRSADQKLFAWYMDCPETSLATLKAQWLEEIKQQGRRVRNYSAPDDVFEAVPLRALESERRQAGGDA